MRNGAMAGRARSGAEGAFERGARPRSPGPLWMIRISLPGRWVPRLRSGMPDAVQAIRERFHARIEKLRSRIVQLHQVLDEAGQKNAVLGKLIDRHEVILKRMQERQARPPRARIPDADAR